MRKHLALLATLVLLLLSHELRCEAFPVARWQPNCKFFLTSGPSVTSVGMHVEDEHGDFFDVEATRRKLELLVAGGLSESFDDPKEKLYSGLTVTSSSPERSTPLPETPSLDVTLPAPGPLTTIERERRLAEIQLLSQLDHGDEALSDVWDLWFSERGPQAATLLHKADDLMNKGPEHFAESERILRSLIEEYGVHFPEPLNRLATVYHLQGRMEEALTLNKMVLSVKPWHFGALSHIVMVYAALKDSQSARQWAAFRLPKFTSGKENKRRSKWVERAVSQATLLLDQRQKETHDAFGESDNEWINDQIQMRNIIEILDDSWQ